MNSEFREALETLFEDPSVSMGLLGDGVEFLPSDAREDVLSANILPEIRAKRLRGKLEGYVSQMAAEAIELGEEELPRLRAEASAILVVLRELQRHFPEAFS